MGPLDRLRVELPVRDILEGSGRSGIFLRGGGLRSDLSGHVIADVVHGLAVLPEPDQDVAVIAADAELVAVLVAQDRRDGDGDLLLRVFVLHGAVGVDAVLHAEVRGELDGLLVHLVEIRLGVVAVIADFELDPVRTVVRVRAAVAAPLGSRATAPGSVVPGKDLGGGNAAVGQLADEGVDASLKSDVVPVVGILVFADFRQELSPILGVIVRLDIALDGGIAGPGVVPQDADGSPLRGVLVARTLSHKAFEEVHAITPLPARPQNFRERACSPRRPGLRPGCSRSRPQPA